MNTTQVIFSSAMQAVQFSALCQLYNTTNIIALDGVFTVTVSKDLFDVVTTDYPLPDSAVVLHHVAFPQVYQELPPVNKTDKRGVLITRYSDNRFIASNVNQNFTVKYMTQLDRFIALCSVFGLTVYRDSLEV